MKRFAFAVLLCALVVSMLFSSDIFWNKLTRETIAAEWNTNCTNAELSWGDWCVYYGLDASGNRNLLPQVIIPGFVNVYHPSPWYRNGELNMLIGGWNTLGQQNDNTYRLKTSDPLGLGGWEIVPGPGGKQEYIGNFFETPESTNLPSDITQDRNGAPIITDVNGQTVYKAFHTVQPDIIPAYDHPGKPNCCDTIYYSYDYEGRFPEIHVGVHYAFLDKGGILNKASESTGKNPLIDWHAFDNLGGTVVSGVSDSRVTYDPTTKKFYMAFVEWHYDATASISLAVSEGWSNSKYTVVSRNLTPAGANPKIIAGPDGKYYLFYTEFKTLHLSIANKITGPYSNDRTVLTPPVDTGLTNPGTPYVFCNRSLNNWQMYFSAGKSITENQIYTAFMRKPCNQPPVWTSSMVQYCPRKAEGDADCRNSVDLLDFQIFLTDFRDSLKGVQRTYDSNFDGRGGVDLMDYNIWRQTYVNDL